MKSLCKAMGAASVLAAGLAAIPAHAGVGWSVSVGVPVYAAPRPVYVTPRPVYVTPQPVYVERQPVYEEPRPAYVEPTVVYREPAVTYESDPAPGQSVTVVTQSEYRSYPPAVVVAPVYEARPYWHHRHHWRGYGEWRH